MLTVEQVCEVSGLVPQTLRNWVANGVVVPTVSLGEGKGYGHRFSVPQAVGLAVAAEVRRSPRGAALPFIERLVAEFAAMTEAQLQAEFDRGFTHLVLTDPVTLFTPHPKRTDEPDVRAAYSRVIAKLGK